MREEKGPNGKMTNGKRGDKSMTNEKGGDIDTCELVGPREPLHVAGALQGVGRQQEAGRAA